MAKSDEMCISEREYQELLAVGKEARDLARDNCHSLEVQGKKLTQVVEAVYGNGHAGLRSEIEVIKATMGLKDSHIEQMAQMGRENIRDRVDEVKDRSVDWKFIGMVLMQALLGLLIAGLHFTP